MAVSPFGGSYFTGDGRGAGLRQPLQQWIYRHPNWTSALSSAEGRLRRSTAQEVAEQLVQDPAVQEILGALTSGLGEAIEEAVLSQWMDPIDAQLMTSALTRAGRIITNQNVPVWKRGEVLLGAAGVIVVVCLIALVVHHAHEQSGGQKKGPSASRHNPRRPRRSR